MKIDVRKLEILQARECLPPRSERRIRHKPRTYLRIINGSEKIAPLTVGKNRQGFKFRPTVVNY